MLLLSSESSSGRSISSMAPAAFRQWHEQKCMPRLKATQIKANKAISHADSRTCSDANTVLFLSSESSSGKSMSSLAPAACRRWHEQSARCQAESKTPNYYHSTCRQLQKIASMGQAFFDPTRYVENPTQGKKSACGLIPAMSTL